MTDQSHVLRHIHLDAVGGVAGDMFVAALLDGFPLLTERVMQDIAGVLPSHAGRPELTEGLSGGIRAQRFGLVAAAPDHDHDVHAHHHSHHGHDHDDHHHAHGHDHHHERDHQHDHGHNHGVSFASLKECILGATLAPGTASHAVAILTILAEAEAHIHGRNVMDVHFHEVGDWDSLMDVVAAGSIIAALGSVRWTVSELPLGSGFIKTAHGLLPVPVPATTAILAGFHWRDDGIAGERVTPTGAAILRYLCAGNEGGRGRSAILQAEGTGAGTKELPGLPNVLRVLSFSSAKKPSDRDEIDVLAFTVDDMSGEEIGVAADRLRADAAVLDLVIIPVFGKKGRPTSRFELLVDPAETERIANACLFETSTIGVRWHREERRILPRSLGRRGGVRVKRVDRPGGGDTAKVESDDLAAISGLANRRKKARIGEGRHA